MFAASMQNMILEALQLTLNNALDGSTALEAEIANYPELLKVSQLRVKQCVGVLVCWSNLTDVCVCMCGGGRGGLYRVMGRL